MSHSEICFNQRVDLDFSFGSLIGGFTFGVVGFYLFRHGKKQLNYSQVFTGVAMMIYPYFVSGPLAMWGIGLALCGLAYYVN